MYLHEANMETILDPKTLFIGEKAEKIPKKTKKTRKNGPKMKKPPVRVKIRGVKKHEKPPFLLISTNLFIYYIVYIIII